MSRQYSMHSSNSYVATSIIMSQHSFSAAFVSWCRDSVFLVATMMLSYFFKLVWRPSFSYRDSISVLVLVATLSCIIVISIATQKVYRDRVMSPLSLFPLLQLHFFIATWTFVFGMFCMSRPQYVMSRRHFSVCSIFSCCDLAFLVAT